MVFETSVNPGMHNLLLNLVLQQAITLIALKLEMELKSLSLAISINKDRWLVMSFLLTKTSRVISTSLVSHRVLFLLDISLSNVQL